MLRTFFAQDRQEIVARKIKSSVCRNRLNDHRRDLIFIFAKGFAHKIDIIEGQRNCKTDKRLRNADTVRSPVR